MVVYSVFSDLCARLRSAVRCAVLMLAVRGVRFFILSTRRKNFT